MKINDKVRSKNKNGMFQEIGTVKALFDPQYYQSIVKYDPDTTWSVNFPNWKEKLVAVVVFDVSKKTATIEEWYASARLQGITPKSYDNCPVTDCCAFPYDDLEIV
jgi:hypothetical protein